MARVEAGLRLVDKCLSNMGWLAFKLFERLKCNTNCTLVIARNPYADGHNPTDAPHNGAYCPQRLRTFTDELQF